MKLKRWMTLALSGVLAAGTLGYASVPAKADVAYSTEYEITIPSTLNVQNAGWNATTGITAKLGNGEAFDSSKKLTVTAASAHGWTLVSDNNTVGYNLATEGNNDSVYNAQAEVPSWEFAADEITTEGKNKGMGIIVEDYSEKPAGSYQDTVTFTAKVEDTAPATVLSGALVDGAIIKVNFKWRGRNSGDYVQGTYNADSGTFTVSKGGSDWGTEDRRAVYKVEKSGDNIIIGVGFYDYTFESMVWTFNTTNDTYTTTNGDVVNDDPGEYGLISVTLNGTDITSQLTKQ